MTEQYRYGVTMVKTERAVLYIWAKDGFDAADKARRLPDERWPWDESAEYRPIPFIPGAGGPVGNQEDTIDVEDVAG